MSSKLYTISDICRIFSISRRTLERLRKSQPNGICVIAHYGVEPPFPPADLQTGRIIRWYESSVINWVNHMTRVQRKARMELNQ